MRNRLIICLLLITLLVMPTMAVAKEPKVSISIKTSEGNNNFIMEIAYNKELVSKVEARLLYDNKKIKYIGGGSYTKDSQVFIESKGDDPCIQLRFKGLQKGKTTVKLETDKAYDLDGKVMDVDIKEKEISILNVGVAGENQDVDDTSDKSQIVTEKVKYEPFETDIYHTMILFGSVAATLLASSLVLAIIYFRRR